MSPADRSANRGAAGAVAGATAIALFVAGAVVIGERPGMDAPGSEVAAYLVAKQERVQIGCALLAASAPLLVFFFASIAELAQPWGVGARRAAATAHGCGLVFVALFLADVAALAVGALRPDAMAASPELAAALRDLEWMAIAVASFLGAGVLTSYAGLALLHGAVWPRWLGWGAVLAACAYALRIGALFTTHGPFAADGPLGLWIPVAAFAGWLLAASVVLGVGGRRPVSTAG